MELSYIGLGNIGGALARRLLRDARLRSAAGGGGALCRCRRGADAELPGAGAEGYGLSRCGASKGRQRTMAPPSGGLGAGRTRGASSFGPLDS